MCFVARYAKYLLLGIEVFFGAGDLVYVTGKTEEFESGGWGFWLGCIGFDGSGMAVSR